MEETSAVSSLLKAVERYFALMYDCDTSNFEKVFRPTAQLHGFREGKMSMWSAGEYKEILKNRESPKAQGAPREERILMLDFASPTQALAKVRVMAGYATTAQHGQVRFVISLRSNYGWMRFQLLRAIQSAL